MKEIANLGISDSRKFDNNNYLGIINKERKVKRTASRLKDNPFY